MKKRIRTIAAFLLSAAMAASMSLTAFATSTPGTGTVTVITGSETADVTVGVAGSDSTTANAGDTLYAYKVIDAVYSPASNSLTYAFTEKFRTFQASAAGSAYASLTVDGYIALGSDSTALKSLLGAFTAYVKVKTNNVTADKSVVTDANGTGTFKDLAMGQYIIVGGGTSTGAKIYQTVTAEVIPTVADGVYKLATTDTVSMKTTKPTAEKKIDKGTTQDTAGNETANIGDTITYTISGTVPTYPEGSTNTTYYQKDTLSAGLTLSSASDAIDVEGIAADGTTKQKLTIGTDYTITISGQNLYIDYVYDRIKTYAKVSATYSAILNENAKVGTKDGNPNTYDLIWSNSPFDGTTGTPTDHKTGQGYGSDEKKKTVYTYALIIDKYDEKTTAKLANAEFDVKDSNGKVLGHIVTDGNGTACYTGLKQGTYYLHETKAPAGYKLLADDVIITIDSTSTAFASATTTTTTTYTTDKEKAIIPTQAINDDGVPLWIKEGGTVTVASAAIPTDGNYLPAYVLTRKTTVTTSGDSGKGSAADGYYKTSIANAPGSSLPTTGGMGTVLFTVIGLILMIGAAVVLATKKRMQNKGNL
jgi:LPXTG-motif cell wall-anchored protein